jgi:hypothetical protein
MPQNEFQVKESSAGYRVELCRDGEPYVTFLDGLTRQGAEREARSLTALWAKLSTPRPAAGRASVPQEDEASENSPATAWKSHGSISA